MVNRKYSGILLMISILMVPVVSAVPVRAPNCSTLGFAPSLPGDPKCDWQDINGNAYLNPPSNPPLDSVYMFPIQPGQPEEGWAVGESLPSTDGTTALPSIFHYDGTNWNLVPAPKFQDFPNEQSNYALDSVNFGPPLNPISKNDGWAVGFNASGKAVAIHWDGVTWRTQVAGLTGPDAGPLLSVFMVSSTDVWAVGENTIYTGGTFWHWTGVPGLGGGWNLVQPPVASVLRSVFMVSSTEGWAVGDSGAIYHYYAGSWTAFSSPVTTGLNSVFMLSPTDGWAVGDDGVVIHYAGGVWSGPVSPGTTLNTLFSVFMVSSTEGWAVGGGVSQSNATIIHYTGGTWTALPSNLIPVSPVNGFSLNSVFFKNAADGWAVGSSGVIVHFDGANWGGITSPTYDNFTSISFGPPLTGPVDPNDGWAVGNASIADSLEPTVFHWNGFMWTKGVVIGARNNLNSVYMLNGGDVWAVGGGAQPTASCTASPTKLCPVILHFNGGSWNTVTPPAGAYSLKSVFMVSSNEGWAVGETAGTGSPYGAGAAGIILHYTVSGGVGTWAIFPAPSSPFLPSGLVPPLNSVFMLGQNEGWAVGDNATILHYTVTGGIGTWNLVTVSGTPTLSPSANLTSIFMLSPSAGWAVGGIQATGSYSAGPVIIYWDGFKWTPVATPTIPGGITPTGHTSALLKSVFCTDANNCYAVGYPGKLFATILHWDGFAWTHITTTPALLGKIPPILTSVYLINGSGGWIVGSDPDFDTDPNFMLPSFGLRTALSTILRCVPQFITTTLTTTVVSTICTVCSATTAAQVVTTTVTTISTFSTNTTVVPPPTPSLIWIIPLLAAVLAGLLLLILFLLLRRKPKPPAVCYPVQRRPC